MFDSSVFSSFRLHGYPEILAEAEGYAFCNLEMACSTRSGLDEERMTVAPCSNDASATA